MNAVKVEEISPCCKKISVEMPSEKVDEVFNKVIDLYQKNAKLDGFRRGSVPKELIYNHFNKDIKEEVKQHIVEETYAQAIKEANIKPIALLNIEGIPERGKSFEYEMTLEVVPPLKLPKYKGIPLKKPEETTITDETVEKRLQEILMEYGGLKPSEHQKMEDGDSAIIDYDGTIDGKPVEALDPSLKNSFIAIGRDVETNKIKPYLNFEDHLIGMGINEERDVEINFPKNFAVKSIAGKRVIYKVKIKSLLTWKPIELDEFLSKNPEGFKTVDELKARIKTALEKAAAQKKKEALREELSNYLLEKTDLEIPPSLIVDEVERMASSIKLRALMSGIHDFDKEEFIKNNKEQMMDTAARRVKLDFIIYDIAKAENIEVSDDEVNAYIEQQALSAGRNPDEYKENLRKRDLFMSVKMHILYEKTMEWLLNNAEIGGSGNIFARLFKR